jgi:hypothetical protein
LGQKKGILKKILGEGPILIDEKENKFKERREHRRRIRSGRDIFKEV